MAQLQDEDVGIQVFDAALVNIGPPSLAGRESPQKVSGAMGLMSNEGWLAS